MVPRIIVLVVAAQICAAAGIPKNRAGRTFSPRDDAYRHKVSGAEKGKWSKNSRRSCGSSIKRTNCSIGKGHRVMQDTVMGVQDTVMGVQDTVMDVIEEVPSQEQTKKVFFSDGKDLQMDQVQDGAFPEQKAFPGKTFDIAAMGSIAMPHLATKGSQQKGLPEDTFDAATEVVHLATNGSESDDSEPCGYANDGSMIGGSKSAYKDATAYGVAGGFQLVPNSPGGNSPTLGKRSVSHAGLLSDQGVFDERFFLQRRKL